MPQLDILHTLLTYMWTWIVMISISQKMGPFTLSSKPKDPLPHKNHPKLPPLPWF